MKKRPIVISIIIILSIISLIYFGGNLFSLVGDSVFSESYILYDDFSNENYDKWEYKVDYTGPYGSTCGGKEGIYINEEREGSDMLRAGVVDGKGQTQHVDVRWILNCPKEAYTGYITSERLFDTEDIKIKVDNDFTIGCSRGDSGKIMYGDVNIPIPVIRGAYVGRCGVSGAVYSYYQRGTLEIKRYDDLDLSKWVAIWNGEEIVTGNNYNAESLVFSGNMKIDEVRYSPYYSCEIDYQNEVVVRDRFGEGSEVNVETLTYTPTKFCPEDLGVLIFSEQGFTDEKGSITKDIAEGKTLIIPDNQYWQIDYVTDYISDMTERCELGEVYDTELNRCYQVNQQQIPDISLLECDSDDDCIIPPNCKLTTSECVDSMCVYDSSTCTEIQILNYLEVIKTLNLDEARLTKLPDNEIQVSFINEKNVLGSMFTSTKPAVLYNEAGEGDSDCYVEWDDYVDLQKCYQTRVIWGEHDFVIKGGETIELNEYISVTYEMTGRGAFRGDKGIPQTEYYYEFVDETDWKNAFVLNLNNLVEIETFEYEEFYTLNETANLKLKLKNNVLSSINGGYVADVRKDIRSASEYIESDIVYGDTYNIPLTTNELGVYSVNVKPYINVYDDVNYFFEELSFGYYVSITDDIQLPPPSTISLNYRNILIVASVILLLILIFVMVRRK